MKKIYFLLFTLLLTVASFGQTTVFINEIHYDNAGGDVDEGVEIAGPAGTDLSTYTITAYNGNGGSVYNTVGLMGTIADDGSGYGTIWFPISGLQNGSPDGLALDNNGTLIQFLSYEGSFDGVGGVADGVTSTEIGSAETSGTPIGNSLQLVGSGDTYEEFTWAIEMASTYGTVNTGQTFTAVNTPSLTITAPMDGMVFDPGTGNVTLSINVQNFDVQPGGTGDGYIEWTLEIDGSPEPTADKFDTNDESIPVTDGTNYFIIMDLVNNSGTPIGVTAFVGFDVAATTQLGTIAELRAVADNGVYELTGEAILTFQQSFRGQKFIQDATGGILIDDNSGNITTVYNVGDGITGITGTVSEFGGMRQFVPIQDSGAPTSTGNTVTPQAVTLIELAMNAEDYESELVVVSSVMIDNTVNSTFINGTEYAMDQGGDMFNFRTTFFDVDYIGGTVPTVATDIVGIVNERSGNAYFLTARDTNDFSAEILSDSDFSLNSFEVYPNPVSSGNVTISGLNGETANVSVFDVLGKRVKTATVSNTLDVSGLKSGVYILNISQEGISTTKKLVIK